MTLSVRVFRGISSFILATTFALVLTNLLTNKTSLDFALVALLSILFFLSRNLLRGITFFSISFAVASFMVSSNSIQGLFTGFIAHRILILIAIVWLLLLVVDEILDSHSMKSSSRPLLDFYIVLITLPLSAYWSRGSEVSALRYLASSGEDNGAWLQGLSAGISEGAPIYSPASYFGGGTTLSTFHAMAQSIFSGLSQAQVTNLDNVLILQREYGLLSLLIVAIAFGISYLKLHYVNEFSRLFGAGVIALISYASVAAVMTSGHLSALVTIWLVFALFALATEARVDNKSLNLIFLTICGIFLILSASRSWYPFMPVGAIAIIGLLARIATNLYKESSKERELDRNKKILLLASGAALLTGLAIMSFKVLQPYVIGSWGELLKNLGYGGGSYSASALILGIVIVIVAINAIDPSIRNFKITNIEILFLSLTLLYLLAVTLLSLISPPNRTLMYSAIKLQLVFVVIAIPYVVRWLYKKLNNSDSKFSLVFISGAMLTLFVFEVSLGQFVNYPLKMNRESIIWATGVTKALKNDPNARIVCLNPNTDGRDYQAYVCSRMSSGITGGFSEPDSLWQAKHLGSISNERFRDEIPEDFYDNLTIVSFDPEKRLSDDPARQDWMQHIPWKQVNVVGAD
jgi:hypothetical protein